MKPVGGMSTKAQASRSGPVVETLNHETLNHFLTRKSMIPASCDEKGLHSQSFRLLYSSLPVHTCNAVWIVHPLKFRTQHNPEPSSRWGGAMWWLFDLVPNSALAKFLPEADGGSARCASKAATYAGSETKPGSLVYGVGP